VEFGRLVFRAENRRVVCGHFSEHRNEMQIEDRVERN
jgi:hypothetical protein